MHDIRPSRGEEGFRPLDAWHCLGAGRGLRIEASRQALDLLRVKHGVDGEPESPERECFPPAIRFKLGGDGMPADEREEPIAADARPQGDGKEIAKQKIVAGLLGLPLDQIMRRAERARNATARPVTRAPDIACLRMPRPAFAN